MKLMKNKLLSLLMAFVMAVNMFPTSAFAAEDSNESELIYEISGDTELVELTTCGTVGNSTVYWELDADTGRLLISGNGGCTTFTSAEDQPWAHLRDGIREVWFHDMEALSIENLAYWFEDCLALTVAEIPYTTPVIGNRAFANCPNLEELRFYYYDEDNFYIAPDAFVVDTKTNMRVCMISEQQLATHRIVSYAWEDCNREVYLFDVYSILPLPTCGLGACTCTGDCEWYYDYIPMDATKHNELVRCTNCNGSFSLGGKSHTFGTNGYCTLCGYSGSTDSGGSDSYTCYHYYTSTSWYGCDWYEYCDSCDELVDSGISHGIYVYGTWQYYTTSQHRRTYACSDCGEGSYSYGYHSTTTVYSKYSASQHTKASYCATCNSYIGSSTTESHSFTYGMWQNISATQHQRTVSCSTCGYSTTETASHTITNTAWESISGTEHRRTESCACGHSVYVYGSHADESNDGYCDNCSYEMTRFSVTVPANLILTVSENGTVYAPTNAAIINHSTGAVAVKSITITTANGWKIVPYNYNMAQAKVDSKLIGFAVNGAETVKSGYTETLNLSGSWQIAKDASLPLDYNAVISATSVPIHQQVLTIVFVVDWA